MGSVVTSAADSPELVDPPPPPVVLPLPEPELELPPSGSTAPTVDPPDTDVIAGVVNPGISAVCAGQAAKRSTNRWRAAIDIPLARFRSKVQNRAPEIPASPLMKGYL